MRSSAYGYATHRWHQLQRADRTFSSDAVGAGTRLYSDSGASRPKGTRLDLPKNERFGIEAVRPDREIDFSKLRQVGSQSGSNTGALFEHIDTGERFYVKVMDKEERVYNELLGGKLYELAGIEVPELNLITVNGKLGSRELDGKLGIASTIILGDLKQDRTKLTTKSVPGAFEGFITDAWLANWDVCGMGYDNLLILTNNPDDPKERAVRVDVGGVLWYRARGERRPASWLNGDAKDVETMRDSSTAYEAGAVFERMSQKDLEQSAVRVIRIKDEDIRAVVKQYGPRDAKANKELQQILIDRKNDIASRFPNAAKLVASESKKAKPWALAR